MLLRRIRYFQAVVQCGSFTEAAEECHISQSAISQQIAALETELGVKLMERHNRRFSLTPSGEYFHRKSLVLTAELEQMCRETVRLSRQDAAQFTIGYLRNCEGPELQRAIAKFAGRYPDITIQTESRSHEGLYDMMRFGHADIVLNDQRRAFSDEYVNLVLAEGRGCVEVSANSPLAQLESVDIHDLRNAACILVAVGEERESEEEYYRSIVGFHGDFLFADSLDEARLLVLSNRGVMPLDEVGTPAERQSVPIVRIPLCRNGKRLTRNYCAFWKATHPGEYVRAFAEILREQFLEK